MGFITALGPLAIDMYLPAFAAIADDFNVSHGQVERTLASYLLGLSLAQLFYGALADRFGRKKTLIAGLCIFIMASLGCAFASDIQHLIYWRIAQAFGGAAGMVVPRAVIRDQLDTRNASKALSLVMLVMGATPILAPIFGAQILIFASWKWIFLFMVLAGVILISFVIFKMEETLNPEYVAPLKIKLIAKNYKELLQHKRFMCYALAGGFGSAGMFSYIAGSPRIFIDIYGVAPENFGFLFGLNASALILMSQVSAKLLNKFTPEQLLKSAQISLVFATAIAILLTLFNVLSLSLLMLCLIGFMGSQGFVSPNCAALALREQGTRLGAASAMMGSLHMLCGASAGVLISAWQSSTAIPLTAILFFCASCSWIFGFIARRS